MDRAIYVCSNCGGIFVYNRVWVSLNSDEPVELTPLDYDNTYCDNCGYGYDYELK